MPLIAISRCRSLDDYETSVRLAGADPWIVDGTVANPDAVVQAAGGLLLTGGGDVQPELYGHAMHPLFSAAEAGRDEYEIALARHALEADLPVFAICRGLQVLNVARGGTLIQDIPSERPSSTPHQWPTPPHPAHALAHTIRVGPNTLLSALLGDQPRGGVACQVNSRHHQAIDTMGEGLLATALAADGIIEAVEDPGHRFCLGVQWHPENFCHTGEFQPLFDAFVRASRP